MEYTVQNIVYVPATDTIQSLVKFSYNSKDEFAVMSYSTSEYSTLTCDVKALQNDPAFVALIEVAIDEKKKTLDTIEY